MRCLLAGAAVLALVGLAAVVNTHPLKADAGIPASRAEPGLIWRYGSQTLTLTDSPCPFEEIAQELETEGIPPARAYVVVQGERRNTGCWAADLGGDVMTRAVNGPDGVVPLDWFRG